MSRILRGLGEVKEGARGAGLTTQTRKSEFVKGMERFEEVKGC